MDDHQVSFGKYSGIKFKDLINKDINYCLWVAKFKYTNEQNKDLVNYLKARENELKEIVKNKKIEQIKKQYES